MLCITVFFFVCKFIFIIICEIISYCPLAGVDVYIMNKEVLVWSGLVRWVIQCPGERVCVGELNPRQMLFCTKGCTPTASLSEACWTLENNDFVLVCVTRKCAESYLYAWIHFLLNDEFLNLCHSGGGKFSALFRALTLKRNMMYFLVFQMDIKLITHYVY